jgi:NAD+ kinase
MVIDGKSHISVNIKRQNEELYLTVDGQQSKELKDKDKVHISMSPYSCKLIKLEGYDYFDILRKKITSRTKECEGDK